MLPGVAVSTCLLVLLRLNGLTSMRVTGKWSTLSFKKAVARFGFDAHQTGFFYGNITPEASFIVNSATLVFVNGAYYKSNSALYRGIQGRTRNCSAMFEPLQRVALMPRDTCTNESIQGKLKDFLRSVPCKEGDTCRSQPGYNVTGRRWPLVVPLVANSQFTFRVNISSPEDWYAVLIGCSISPVNATANHTWKDCQWDRTPNEIRLQYNMWLVNGNPNGGDNFFTFQFSFELQGVLEMCFVFLVLYAGLLMIHFYGVFMKKAPGHTLIRLYTSALICEAVGVALQSVHYIIYGMNGVGIVALRHIGDLFVVATQCLFMLLLLLIAKGWTITTVFLIHKKYVAVLWITYVVLYITLFVVNALTHLNEFSGKSAYQSIPGGFILALRCLILIWFLYELRISYLQENVQAKLALYRFIGVFYTLWFIYLPIAVGALSDIDVLYQFKVIFGTLHSADFLSLAAMAWLFWPSRSKAYFKLTVPENRKLLESMNFGTI